MANPRIGVMACMSCGKEVPVKKTATGKLSAPCAWCDFLNYADPDTIHYKNVLAKVTLDAPEKPAAPAAAPPPAPPAAPPRAKYPHER